MGSMDRTEGNIKDKKEGFSMKMEEQAPEVDRTHNMLMYILSRL